MRRSDRNLKMLVHDLGPQEVQSTLEADVAVSVYYSSHTDAINVFR